MHHDVFLALFGFTFTEPEVIFLMCIAFPVVFMGVTALAWLASDIDERAKRRRLEAKRQQTLQLADKVENVVKLLITDRALGGELMKQLAPHYKDELTQQFDEMEKKLTATQHVPVKKGDPS